MRHRPRLTIQRCSTVEARTAVERWHYSRRMPAATPHRYAVWEDGRCVGVVLFGCGANRHLGRPFGLDQGEVLELVRVALSRQRAIATTRIVAACLKQLRLDCPAVRLVVSYADTAEGHVGVVYQAASFAYLGPSVASVVVVGGRAFHRRSLHERYGTSRLDWLRANVDRSASAVTTPPKHKYAYALDKQMRRRLRRMAQPYPRAVKESIVTRPASSREGGVQLALTAPSASSVSCGRPSEPAVGSPAAPAPRR